MNKLKEIKNNKGVTLIVLIITIIVLLILAGVTIAMLTGDNGILGKSGKAKEETQKQTATEKINLKITNVQMDSFANTQTMPTLQNLADAFCEDNEIQYVELASKEIASLEKITVGSSNSIFTKLKEYPYEFEIDSSLRLASINGVKIADTNSDYVTKEELQQTVSQITTAYEGKIAELQQKIDNLEATAGGSGNSLPPKTLIYNESKTSGTVTLSESMFNYKYLLIYYTSNGSKTWKLVDTSEISIGNAFALYSYSSRYMDIKVTSDTVWTIVGANTTVIQKVYGIN